jgi:hypothetical protein
MPHSQFCFVVAVPILMPSSQIGRCPRCLLDEGQLVRLEYVHRVLDLEPHLSKASEDTLRILDM